MPTAEFEFTIPKIDGRRLRGHWDRLVTFLLIASFRVFSLIYNYTLQKYFFFRKMLLMFSSWYIFGGLIEKN